MAYSLSPSSNSDNTTPDGVSSSNSYNSSGYDAPNTPPPNNPSAARLAGSGLIAGAGNVLSDIAGRVFNFDFKAANGTPLPMEDDWRLRISMQPATASIFYDNPQNRILYPLSQTRGLIFPYTPSVTINHAARYGNSPLTHSNYASFFYEGSEVGSISINADFTVQNFEEGQYLMAAIQFMRATTKMFYGQSQLAGTPPPIVLLNGYGPAYLPNVPCVVTTFSHTMPADVDYIDVPVGIKVSSIAGDPLNQGTAGVRTRLPTSSQLQITLQPVYSRKNVHENFTLEKFAGGSLISGAGYPGQPNLGGFL
jgi:hypothetical protein